MSSQVLCCHTVQQHAMGGRGMGTPLPPQLLRLPVHERRELQIGEVMLRMQVARLQQGFLLSKGHFSPATRSR